MTAAYTEGTGMQQQIALDVDGHEHRLKVDTRTTLLDLLREQLGADRATDSRDLRE